MNRIRKVDNVYQVLITPDIKVSPDMSLILGNWEDESLRDYHVLQFETLNDAQCEAFKYPDLDWYKIVLNHEQIFQRLKTTIKSVLDENKLNVEFRARLMDPETLKNIMFDRVLNAGERFNLRYGLNDIIQFTIINPWTNNLQNIAKTLENYRAWLNRDDLRLRQKKIVDGKIICLYGYTEYGTIYEIKLIPTLLQQWAEWFLKNGFRNDKMATTLYNKIVNQQDMIDNGIILK